MNLNILINTLIEKNEKEKERKKWTGCFGSSKKKKKKIGFQVNYKQLQETLFATRLQLINEQPVKRGQLVGVS